ncbi:MAG: M13 family metallopeptidase [Candidatus Aphodosoma sp.]|nr:M13 family metallopeptidase [Candidatus Aphodosoma sp.]
MKKINFFIMLSALFLAACNSSNGEQKLSAGIRMENMDTTAVPGEDFYKYACGGWMKLNPIPAEYSRYGSFDKLGEDNQKRLQAIFDDVVSKRKELGKGSDAQKIADFYTVAMDSVRLNAEGFNPIIEDLKKIDNINNASDVAKYMGEVSNVNIFFGMYVDADIKNAKSNLLQTYQGGIGMGQKDYYFDTTESITEVRNAYVQHVQKMFEMIGVTTEEAANNAKLVMNIESRIANSHFSQVELRDPEGNYNKYSYDDLLKEYPDFDWKALFDAMNIKVKEISISQPSAVKEAIAILNDTPIDQIKTYIKWQLINSASSYLSDDFSKENFEFYGKIMSGSEEQSPRWKRAVEVVNSSLGMAVGRIYCDKYFHEDAKKRMEKLVDNLLKAYSERINNLDWMSEETKAKAQEKLSAIYVKVGYPNKWIDYSSLEINKDDSYWDIVKKASKFEVDFMLDKLNRPVDKDDWYMTPQTVNAYYNPTTNEICFPAGILQYPFFDMEADDAFNYGAIGVVIAHEVTHGFDDQGCQFDKDGNLVNWWTDSDKENFTQRTKVMEEYFNQIEVAPGLYANGAFTLGENIADHGGLQVAYHAFKNATKDAPLEVIDGFTPEQRFFISYANVWAGNIRDEEVVRRTKVDPHSLGKWRVNGALPHIGAWYEAFNITPESPLYLAPEKRVSIW